ncbi:MAG: alpha-glucosidase/alpha-galactosidase [Candidatus Hydrogenedentales bacterium]|jgi:alpha-galactosidase
MAKICFLGAGSTVFAKNVLGDCLYEESLRDAQVTLVDVDPDRLHVSEVMMKNICKNLGAKASYTSYLAKDAAKALEGADYVVNAVQVGGYEPATVIDFEIPKKYGLRQTIADTLGIGGIFRGLRTIPVMLDYCRIMEKVCPDALMLNYTNPMAILTGALQRATNIRVVGLCHSVQVCATNLCMMLGLPSDNLKWSIAGINHQGWLLSLSRNGEDLYPEIRRRAQLPGNRGKDDVRFELMKRFGYYVTESSEHCSEYVPWFIKAKAPELLERFQIPLDEYPRRCIAQIEAWGAMRELLLNEESLHHDRGEEYASYIFGALETGVPYTFGGNVQNKGLITNLPANCCVEVLCVAGRSGIHAAHVGELPPQCAALTRTNVNVQELTIEAALTRKKDHIYQAALLDPHTAAELTIDEIVSLCDDLIEAHGASLPSYS